MILFVSFDRNHDYDQNLIANLTFSFTETFKILFDSIFHHPYIPIFSQHEFYLNTTTCDLVTETNWNFSKTQQV